MWEEILFMIFPKMWQDFRVGMGPELMTALGQRGPDVTMVKELAVEDDLYRAVLVGNRLPAIGEANDRETPRGHADARKVDKTVLVRTAVLERSCHRFQQGAGDRLSSPQIDHSGNTAHESDGSPRESDASSFKVVASSNYCQPSALAPWRAILLLLVLVLLIDYEYE